MKEKRCFETGRGEKAALHPSPFTLHPTRVKARGAFTLVEMLVVVGIIAVLVGASVAGYSKIVATAEKTKCQELVNNTATALTALFQREGAWPRVLASRGKTDGELDETAAYPLAKGGYMSLTTDNGKLAGYDRFGIVSPWATDVIKRRGSSATLSDKIPGGGTIQDHRLHFALDLDGDGIIEGASVGGQSVDVRATAIVWCAGKDGKIESYSRGQRRDDVYSWTEGQTKNVK